MKESEIFEVTITEFSDLTTNKTTDPGSSKRGMDKNYVILLFKKPYKLEDWSEIFKGLG